MPRRVDDRPARRAGTSGRARARARRARCGRRAGSGAGTCAPRRGSPAARARCRRRRRPRARRPAKWWPLATICVPDAGPRGRSAAKRSSVAASAPGRRGGVGVEPDRARAPAAARRAPRSRRCVPAPSRASSGEPHAGQSSGAGSAWPQWWQRSAPSAWRTSATSQCGQRRVVPQARQWSAGATPRRLRSRIALPPRSATAPSSVEQRRRERIARLAAQVDDAHRRQRPADPAAERRAARAAPSSRAAAWRCRRPRPRPRARRAWRRPCARRSAGRNPACTRRRAPRRRRSARGRAPARTRPSGRRRRRAPRPATIRSRSSRRSASVEPGVEDGDPVAEPGAEAADGLRRQRDLRHEHDRAEPALERRGARLQVDLGLAAPGGAVEEERAARAARRARATIRSSAPACGRVSAGGTGLAGERLALGRLRPLAAATPCRRRDQRRARGRGSSRSSPRARARARRAPAGARSTTRSTGADLDTRRRLVADLDDDPALPSRGRSEPPPRPRHRRRRRPRT